MGESEGIPLLLSIYKLSVQMLRVCILAVLEEQKAGVEKESSDLRCSLRDVEKARLEARRELQELRRQAKILDGERNKLTNDVRELQDRVAHDEQKDEESRRDNFALKQKVIINNFALTFIEVNWLFNRMVNDVNLSVHRTWSWRRAAMLCARRLVSCSAVWLRWRATTSCVRRTCSCLSRMLVSASASWMISAAALT